MTPDVDTAAAFQPTLGRRRVLALGLSAWSALGLAACGGAGGTDAPDAGRYQTLALPGPLSQHAAVALGGAQVAVIGGSRGQATLSASVDLLDARSGAWSVRAAMATGRAETRALSLGGGLLFVHGGARTLTGAPTAEWIDLAAGTSTPAAPSPRRLHHTVTLLRDGRVLVAGGRSTEGHAGGVSPTLELWDPASRGWRHAARPLQQARHGHSATLLADGSVLFVGGYTADGMAASAERFDPSTETTRFVASPLLARADHSAALQPDGRVLVAGGEQGLLAQPAAPGAAWLDPSSGLVTALPGLPALAETAATGVARGDGRLLLFGGLDREGRAVATVRAIDSAPQSLSPLPEPRSWHSASALPDGTVVVIGGEHDGRLLATALRFV